MFSIWLYDVTCKCLKHTQGYFLTAGVCQTAGPWSDIEEFQEEIIQKLVALHQHSIVDPGDAAVLTQFNIENI